MSTQPPPQRDPQHERLVNAFLAATEGLSLRAASRRSGINPQTIAEWRRGESWTYVQDRSRERLVSYLTNRGLLPEEPTTAPHVDLPFSHAEELIRDYRRWWKMGVFRHLGHDLTEQQVGAAVVRAAEDEGWATKHPAEMARLHRWYADLLETHPTPTEDRNGARRAGS